MCCAAHVQLVDLELGEHGRAAGVHLVKQEADGSHGAPALLPAQVCMLLVAFAES